jgi:hypothetical protein
MNSPAAKKAKIYCQALACYFIRRITEALNL